MTEKIGKQKVFSEELDSPRRTQVEPERTQTGTGRGDKGWITIQVLNRIKQGMTTPELLKEVVGLLAGWTGFDAVGLRLQEGKDYPYFQTIGMTEEFVLLENSLCPRKHEPAHGSGSGGADTELECACGAVLQGRIDRSQPFVTEYGSLLLSVE